MPRGRKEKEHDSFSHNGPGILLYICLLQGYPTSVQPGTTGHTGSKPFDPALHRPHAMGAAPQDLPAMWTVPVVEPTPQGWNTNHSHSLLGGMHPPTPHWLCWQCMASWVLPHHVAMAETATMGHKPHVDPLWGTALVYSIRTNVTRPRVL